MQTFSQLYQNLTNLPNGGINRLDWISFVTCWVLIAAGLFNIIYPTVKRIKNKRKNKIIFT